MLISFAVTAKLICVFVFAYAKCWFSHDVAHLLNNTTVKFLNFWTPENFAVIYLKFKQRGQTLGYFVKMMQWNSKQWRPWSDCSSRSSLIWVCTVCPDLSVQKLRIITAIQGKPPGSSILVLSARSCASAWQSAEEGQMSQPSQEGQIQRSLHYFFLFVWSIAAAVISGWSVILTTLYLARLIKQLTST